MYVAILPYYSHRLLFEVIGTILLEDVDCELYGFLAILWIRDFILWYYVFGILVFSSSPACFRDTEWLKGFGVMGTGSICGELAPSVQIVHLIKPPILLSTLQPYIIK